MRDAAGRRSSYLYRKANTRPSRAVSARSPSMPTSVMPGDRDVAGHSIADQFAPVLRLHEEVRAATRPVVNLASAQARMAAGHPGFDAMKLLSRTRTLSQPFDRAVDALELCGLASSTVATAVRRAGFDPNTLAMAWASGDRPPSTATHRLARRAAGIVASAILRKNAGRVTKDAVVNGWARPNCPCCGGAPDLASGSGQHRTLFCARCDTRWKTRGRGCLGCDASTGPTIARVRTPYLGYDLVICHNCGRYLKERTGALQYHPLVERALTAEMDAAAERRGLRL